MQLSVTYNYLGNGTYEQLLSHKYLNWFHTSCIFGCNNHLRNLAFTHRQHNAYSVLYYYVSSFVDNIKTNKQQDDNATVDDKPTLSSSTFYVIHRQVIIFIKYNAVLCSMHTTQHSHCMQQVFPLALQKPCRKWHFYRFSWFCKGH